MSKFEYIVVPAPTKGLKAKGLRSPEARFAHALATAMNMLGADGWEYVRADTLPSEERQGLTKTKTVYHNMLVFRRPRVEAVEQVPVPAEPTIEAQPAPAPPPEPFFPRLVAENPGWEDGGDLVEEAEADSILSVLATRRAAGTLAAE